jgi:uncharacterized protein
MITLEDVLQSLAKFQCKHAKIILLLTIAFTLFMLAGFMQLHIETDFVKELPQDIPIIKDSNMINDKFGGSEMFLILFQLNKTSNSNDLTDIRDPEVLTDLVKLEQRLKERADVRSVQSAGSIFTYSGLDVPRSREAIIFILDQAPQSSQLFNKDYTATIMVVTTESGGSEKIKDVIAEIQDDVNSAGISSNIKVTVSGSAPLQATLMDLLLQDTVFTTILAALMILVLVFILEYFSVMPTVQIFWPIVVGVIWTYGLMGWLGVPLSVVTATIGAMLIGLDVEYGTFMVRRVMEEWHSGKSPEEGIIIAVPAIGRAIVGSGGAMIIGFATLILSSMPMIQHLGIVLSLGIFFRLLMSVFINPAIIFYAKHVEVERKTKKKKQDGNK